MTELKQLASEYDRLKLEVGPLSKRMEDLIYRAKVAAVKQDQSEAQTLNAEKEVLTVMLKDLNEKLTLLNDKISVIQNELDAKKGGLNRLQRREASLPTFLY